MDFTSITIQILKALADFAGSWGMAIILLTVIVRVAMWPLSLSQQRSMRKMQHLAPKLKDIQTRYKSDPQKMQQKMAEFYKEHSFNPFGGCFPLLLQMPIFIMLYTALISTQFIQIAGNSSFLFINRLDATLQSSAGIPKDKIFEIREHDTFSADKVATAYFKNGQQQKVNISNHSKALTLQGTLIPGQPVDFKMDLYALDLKPDLLENQLQKVDISVINNATKEAETVSFEKKGPYLFAEANTVKAKVSFHYDVLILILIFGATMYMSQKVMTATNKSATTDPAQKAMQESMSTMMPIMITGMFVFFPIPAGVLLYMVVSNIIQVIQSVAANKIIEKEQLAQKEQVIDIEATEVTQENSEPKEKGSFSSQKKKGKF